MLANRKTSIGHELQINKLSSHKERKDKSWYITQANNSPPSKLNLVNFELFLLWILYNSYSYSAQLFDFATICKAKKMCFISVSVTFHMIPNFAPPNTNKTREACVYDVTTQWHADWSWLSVFSGDNHHDLTNYTCHSQQTTPED